MGKPYTLKVVRQKKSIPGVHLKKGNIIVSISPGLEEEKERELIKEMLTKWYKDSFGDIVRERIEKYSPELNVAPAKIFIKNQKTRWGSCSTKGNINLNWLLVMTPLEIIDYVIVHELSHLKVMNHSQEFWTLVESILPDYKERRKWLKENGTKKTIFF
ncbi:MAG: M48 family metallopeptidase [Clostridia bacterium]|nr:M48 family metallopeptidase [Clostridia bacterium]